MTNPPEPSKRDVRQPDPGEDFERAPERIEVPDERIVEPISEPIPETDPPSFAPSESGLPKKPDLPSTGLSSDAPGG